ncbi:MAG TPA: hypothetical protein VGR41_08270 [Actinomycetota bacterium]|jgi:hypothetical protein|nr:hypothetical protein [Actinomycetota bacterium]
MEADVRAEEAPEAEEEPAGQRQRWRAVGSAVAGPTLIVACVVFALRGFTFRPFLTNQHPDVLAFWLPRFSFLGRAIANGHVPLWNPFEMTGTRFAADPQAGWLYATPTALFSMLSPGVAMRAFIVFNPILAGLGMFWFLRRESLGRVPATVGGLALAMPMSTSIVAVAMPFAGAIAWTTLVLVGASGYRRATGAGARLGWLGFAALAWSQVAGAHMSHGLGICTLLVAAYLVASAVSSVRAGEASRWRAAGLVAACLVFLPLAGLAVLLPRVDMLAASSLHAGYGALAEERVRGVQDLAIQANGVWAAWPLALGTAPGAFAGAVTLLSVPLAFRSRRHRALVWAFGTAAVFTYVLTLNVLVTASWFRTAILELPYGDVYLHNPGRLRYVWLVVAPVLGAVGVQGLTERVPDRRTLIRWLGVGVGVFLALPLVMGAHPVRFVMLAVGIVIVAPAFLAMARGRPWAALALAGVLAVELLGSAIYSQAYQGGTVYLGLESGEHPNIVPQVLRWPVVPESEFLRETPIVGALRGTEDRYLTWAPPAAYFEKGYLFAQRPRDWPALAMERGTLFGIHDVLGYNPVQLVRYWSFIRATDRLSVFYNAAVINEPTLTDVRLLGARYLIVPVGQALPPGLTGSVEVTDDGYDLIDVDGSEPRATVASRWSVVSDPLAALRASLRPGFDPGIAAVLEADPGLTAEPGAPSGSAIYAESDPENVVVTVETSAPSIVVVRNNWDAGWTASVDGRHSPVLAADGFRQGIPVNAGRHEIRLTYRDPSIGRGIAASAIVWGAWAVAVVTAGIRSRRRRTRARPSAP